MGKFDHSGYNVVMEYILHYATYTNTISGPQRLSIMMVRGASDDD